MAERTALFAVPLSSLTPVFPSAHLLQCSPQLNCSSVSLSVAQFIRFSHTRMIDAAAAKTSQLSADSIAPLPHRAYSSIDSVESSVSDVSLTTVTRVTAAELPAAIGAAD